MKGEAWGVLLGALIVGALMQGVVQKEAVFLGLSTLEVLLLGAAVGAFVKRKMA